MTENWIWILNILHNLYVGGPYIWQQHVAIEAKGKTIGEIAFILPSYYAYYGFVFYKAITSWFFVLREWPMNISVGGGNKNSNKISYQGFFFQPVSWLGFSAVGGIFF